MKNNKNACDLNTCMLCRLCLNEWKPAINTNRKNFYIKKGQPLFNEGESVTGIYFIYNGIVKIHKKWGEEKELILRFAKKGDIAGHRGLGGDTLYPVSATALVDTTVCFIDLDFFKATLRVNHEFLYGLMLFFADELRDSEKYMRNIAHMPVKGRVALALLIFKDKFGVNEDGYINFSITRQDLSSYVGAAYETVFKIVNEFAGEGIIKVSGKLIGIIDELKLSDTSK